MKKTLTLVNEGIDTDWRFTARNIAEMCDLSKSTVYRILIKKSVCKGSVRAGYLVWVCRLVRHYYENNISELTIFLPTTTKNVYNNTLLSTPDNESDCIISPSFRTLGVDTLVSNFMWYDAITFYESSIYIQKHYKSELLIPVIM